MGGWVCGYVCVGRWVGQGGSVGRSVGGWVGGWVGGSVGGWVGQNFNTSLQYSKNYIGFQSNNASITNYVFLLIKYF